MIWTPGWERAAERWPSGHSDLDAGIWESNSEKGDAHMFLRRLPDWQVGNEHQHLQDKTHKDSLHEGMLRAAAGTSAAHSTPRF